MLIATEGGPHGSKGGILAHLGTTRNGAAIAENVWGGSHGRGGVGRLGSGLGLGWRGGILALILAGVGVGRSFIGRFLDGFAWAWSGFEEFGFGKGWGGVGFGLWRGLGCGGAEAGGGRGGGWVGRELGILHGEGVVLFAFLAAEGWVGAIDDLAGGGGVAVTL